MTISREDEVGILAALTSRFETQRLPRLLDIQAAVNRGERLPDYDLSFLDEVFKDAASYGNLLSRHPEYEALSSKVASLYHEITTKALANEASADKEGASRN